MSLVNPFSNSIVADAWEAGVPDVAAIHARAFAVCGEALAEMDHSESSRSVLLYGEPGSGKTHLLARLRARWTGFQEVDQGLPEPKAVFSAIRLRSGSRMVCRHLRRSLVGDLLRRGSDGLSQLDRLLIHRAKRHLDPRDGSLRWWIRLRLPSRAAKARRDVTELFRRFDRDFRLGRNLSRVLSLLALGRYRRDAEEWLREGMLPERLLDEMDLVAMPEEADPEEEALELICALSRLANAALPLVICFDQVEALQTHTRDLEGPFAFGRMISALHDRAQHALLITCVQTTFLETLESAVRAADLDRLRQSVEVLDLLDVAEAESIVATRLELLPELADLRPEQADSLWPLQRDAIREFVQSSSTGKCTPRRLIAWCRQRFDQWRVGKTVVADSVEEFLSDRYEQELQRAGSKSAAEQVDDVLAHALPLLWELLGLPRLVADDPSRDIDLVVRQPNSQSASAASTRARRFSFCNSSGNRLTGRLKRLRQEVERHGAQGLVLIRDSRLALSPNAHRAHQHLAALRERGVPLVRHSGAALAALAALRSLLSDAKAGDLSHAGETLAPQTVGQWLAAHLAGELQDVVGRLQGSGTAPPAEAPYDEFYDQLLNILQEHHVLRIDEVATKSTRDRGEILASANRHRDTVGLLEGPPVVLFERVLVD